MYSELKRTCRRCDTEKNLIEFYKDLVKEGRCKQCVSEIRRAKYSENKEVIIARVTKYRTENPEKIRDTKLKQAYGVGLEWFQTKLDEQDGVCACCKKVELTIWCGKKIALSVDHNHQSGEPRGLLCMRCNRALGLLDESVETLTNMIEYIEKFKKLR